MDNNNNKNSKKGVYLGIITIITICCIIAGCILHLKNWVFGRNTIFNKVADKINVSVERNEELGEQVKAAEEAQAFSKLRMDISIGEVTIEEGDEFQVTYDFPEKLVPKIEMKNNELVITQKDVKNVNFGWKADSKGEIKVTVPEGTKLDKVDIDAALGEVDINKINAKECDVDAALGAIKFSDCKIDSIEADASLGDIELDDCEAGEARLNLSMGHAGVTGKIDAVTVENSMGDIELDGDFKEIDADCDMGAVEVTCDSDFTGKIITSMGQVIVNGVEQGTKYIR